MKKKSMNMRKLLIVVAATPAFVTGTQNLMNDAMTWVLILIPIAASLFCAWKAFCYQAADDNERIMIKKSVKGAVVVAILGECAAAIIKLILSYYAS
jgi:uncharacterized BrkB/YihY/UPF0761 family membrane protein